MTAAAGVFFGLFTFFSGGALPNPVYEAMSKCHKQGGEYSVVTGCKLPPVVPSPTSAEGK